MKPTLVMPILSEQFREFFLNLRAFSLLLSASIPPSAVSLTQLEAFQPRFASFQLQVATFRPPLFLFILILRAAL